MPVGSLDGWVDLLDSYVPDIIALVIDTWEAMPPPAANAKEDPVSELLCRMLRKSRDRCDLPFRIDSQLVELDPAAGEDQGRMDIVFSPTIPREDIYFCLECKRINARNADGVRPYFSEYVRFGMLRFVRMQYARLVRSGGMLAFVLDGDVHGAVIGVEDNIKNMYRDLDMDLPNGFRLSSVRPADVRLRETHHRRGLEPDPFLIHHLFMAGDPAAPMLPEPPVSPPTVPAAKQRRAPARKTRA